MNNNIYIGRYFKVYLPIVSTLVDQTKCIRCNKELAHTCLYCSVCGSRTIVVKQSKDDTPRLDAFLKDVFGSDVHKVQVFTYRDSHFSFYLCYRNIDKNSNNISIVNEYSYTGAIGEVPKEELDESSRWICHQLESKHINYDSIFGIFNDD